MLRHPRKFRRLSYRKVEPTPLSNVLYAVPLPLLPSPTTLPLYAHLMQLSRRVSNASQDDKSLSISIGEFTLI